MTDSIDATESAPVRTEVTGELITVAPPQFAPPTSPASPAHATLPSRAPPRSLEITLTGPAGLLNHRGIVFALLCVAGPIGLPALWFSPRFSRTAKSIITAVFFGLTVVLPLAGAWYALEYLIRPIADALHNANQ